MSEHDLREARRLARQAARVAVGTFAREATLDAALRVNQACNRVRMLDEQHARRRRLSTTDR